MVDWDGLENRSRCKPTVGLNPTPSAAENQVPARADRASPEIRAPGTTHCADRRTPRKHTTCKMPLIRISNHCLALWHDD